MNRHTCQRMILSAALLLPTGGSAQFTDLPSLFGQVRYVTVTDSRIGGNSGFIQFHIGLTDETLPEAERFKIEMEREGYRVHLDSPVAVDLSISRGWKVDYMLPVRIPVDESFEYGLLKFAAGKAFPALVGAAGGGLASSALDMADSLTKLAELYQNSRKPKYKGIRFTGSTQGDYLLRIVRSGGLDQPARLQVDQHLSYEEAPELQQATRTPDKKAHEATPPPPMPESQGAQQAPSQGFIPLDVPQEEGDIATRMKRTYYLDLEQARIFPLPTQTVPVETSPPIQADPVAEPDPPPEPVAETPPPPAADPREAFNDYFKETIWRDGIGEKRFIMHLHVDGTHSMHHKLDGPTVRACQGRRTWFVEKKPHSGRLALETRYYIQDRKCYGGTYSCSYPLDSNEARPKRLDGLCGEDQRVMELILKKPPE